MKDDGRGGGREVGLQRVKTLRFWGGEVGWVEDKCSISFISCTAIQLEKISALFNEEKILVLTKFSTHPPAGSQLIWGGGVN